MLSFGLKYAFLGFFGAYNDYLKGFGQDTVGPLIILLLAIYLIVWVESTREESEDPTVSNIVHELTKCCDAIWTYLHDEGEEKVRNELKEGVNHIDILAYYMDVPGLYRADRYAFCLNGDVLWVGCNLRQWKNSFSAFWGASLLDSCVALLLFHPWDKMGRNNCKRLAQRALEIVLYGSSGLDKPPRSLEDRTYRVWDDVVWMPVSQIGKDKAKPQDQLQDQDQTQDKNQDQASTSTPVPTLDLGQALAQALAKVLAQDQALAQALAQALTQAMGQAQAQDQSQAQDQEQGQEQDQALDQVQIQDQAQDQEQGLEQVQDSDNKDEEPQ